MKITKQTFNLFMLLNTLLLPLSASASDRLSGHWEGRWDNIFKCQFTITQNENQGYHVLYQWEEHENTPFVKKDYIGKKVNSNTILAKNIYLLSHPTDKDRAIAIGVFEQQTRMAYLKRSKNDAAENVNE